MGEFAYTIADQALGRIISIAAQEVSLAWGATDELNKLKDTLSSITILLLDAEEKQTKTRGLTAWLARLKDICYDIEVALDLFAYKLQVKGTGGSKGKVRYFFSRWNPIVSDFKLGHLVKEIRERLDAIDKEKSQYSLVERDGGPCYEPRDMHATNERDTHSVVPSYVIERRDDQEKIIKHLLNDTSSNDENVSVTSIIGLGGLGKTTLAKLVYSDRRVVENFEKRMWVCVSNHFDTKRLVRDIIKSATGENCGDIESLEELNTKLQIALRGNKFLLVLDDVWDDKSIGVNSQKWDSFKTLLNVAVLKGSKIIVTTRNQAVGSIVNSFYIHSLKGLGHMDSMSLFMRKAFQNRVDPQDYPHLMKIGEAIVKKCGGVPLALATLGSLLHSKTDPNDWFRVRDDELWETNDDIVLPALKLSYDALPHHLKPCFAFFSLFPKDYPFHSFEMIPLWMAQDYLKFSKKNQDFEDVGLDYIRQLCSRSLLQIEEDTKLEIRFKMHDLVHDLAISVAQAEHSSTNCRPSSSKMVRHVSISKEELAEDYSRRPSSSLMPNFMLEHELKKVRTLLFPAASRSLSKKCITRFKYLRALKVYPNDVVEEVPSSIGNLIHLRYLCVEGLTGFKNPSSLAKLLNLQYLNIQNCAFEKVPKDIGKLINLRYLLLTTPQEYLPNGIGCLSLLRCLRFDTCYNLKSLGEEIQFLTNLRQLWIFNCPKLESLPPNLNQLTSLDDFTIIRARKIDLMKAGEGIQGLRRLRLYDLSSSVIPHWLENSADTLLTLEIGLALSLKKLPDWLHKSKSLHRIAIKICPQLLALPECEFTALRQVEISDCPRLIETFKRQLKGEKWSKIASAADIILDGNPYISDDQNVDVGDI